MSEDAVVEVPALTVVETPVVEKSKKPKKAKAPKAGKKKVKKATKAKAKKVTARKVGPGTEEFKFKAAKIQGRCDILGCQHSAKTKRSWRCARHTKEVRTAQLAANNKTWRKRVDDATAGHHLVYTSPKTGKQLPTEWAFLNPKRALAVAKKEHKGMVDPETLQKLIASVEKKAEKAVEKAAGHKGRRSVAKAVAARVAVL